MDIVTRSIERIDCSIPNGRGREWLTAAISTQISRQQTSMNYAAVKVAEWGLKLHGKNVRHIFCDAALVDCQRHLICGDCIEKECRLNRDRVGIPADYKAEYRHDYDIERIIEPTYVYMTKGKPDAVLHDKLVRSAKNVINWMERYLDEHDVEGAVLFSGLYFPESALAEVLRRRGVKLYLEEQMVGTGRISYVKDRLMLTKPDHPVKISSRVRKWVEGYPLALNRDYVLVLLGYPYDSLRLIDKSFYNGEPEWLEEVHAMEEKSDIPFVYNPHPVTKPRNPKDSFKLARKAKFVLAYASTAGLEAAAMGLPVVIGSGVHYRDVVYAPRDVNEWRRMVQDGLDGKLKPNQKAAMERLTWFREVQCWDIWKYLSNNDSANIRKFDWKIIESPELENAINAMLDGKVVEFCRD